MTANNNDFEDEQLFRTFVSDVTPLDTQTVAPNQQKPAAKIRKKNTQEMDATGVKKSLSLNEEDSFFAFHVSKKNRKALKSGHVHFKASLDLHGQTVAQSERLLTQFIMDCLHHHIQYAIIIHGQGHHSAHGSVLKPAVLYRLSQHSHVDGYCPAQTRDGGQGASYVLLRNL